jgi:hypothetical protein
MERGGPLWRRTRNAGAGYRRGYSPLGFFGLGLESLLDDASPDDFFSPSFFLLSPPDLASPPSLDGLSFSAAFLYESLR